MKNKQILGYNYTIFKLFSTLLVGGQKLNTPYVERQGPLYTPLIQKNLSGPQMCELALTINMKCV